MKITPRMVREVSRTSISLTMPGGVVLTVADLIRRYDSRHWEGPYLVLNGKACKEVADRLTGYLEIKSQEDPMGLEEFAQPAHLLGTVAVALPSKVRPAVVAKNLALASA